MVEKAIILKAKGICKRFGGVVALNNVDMDLSEGEILGLVGDNGAGKSTLIKIISGVHEKDAGEIYFNGNRVEINNPSDAKALGIETVYQDLALIEVLDISENIFLGREIIYRFFPANVLGFLNFKKMFKEATELLKIIGIRIQKMSIPVGYLSGGQRQAIALSKAVYWGSKIVIMDEPTSALGVEESKKALDLIRTLKDHGISTIVISHNLQHLFSIVDRIMVIRRGENAGTRNVYETSTDEIVSMITGSVVTDKISL